MKQTNLVFYDGTIADINTDEAKEILQMYTEHNAEILAYEEKCAFFFNPKTRYNQPKLFSSPISDKENTIDEVIVGQGLKQLHTNKSLRQMT